jgi:hypothetical protein
VRWILHGSPNSVTLHLIRKLVALQELRARRALFWVMSKQRRDDLCLSRPMVKVRGQYRMWPAKILKNLGSLHAKHWWVAHLEEHYTQGVHLIELH